MPLSGLHLPRESLGALADLASPLRVKHLGNRVVDVPELERGFDRCLHP